MIEYHHDYDEAEKCFKLARDCDPSHVNVMIQYGIFYTTPVIKPKHWQITSAAHVSMADVPKRMY